MRRRAKICDGGNNVGTDPGGGVGILSADTCWRRTQIVRIGVIVHGRRDYSVSIIEGEWVMRGTPTCVDIHFVCFMDGCERVCKIHP